MWGDGFGEVLRDLAADSEFRSAIAAIRALTKPACWDAAAAWGSADPACPVDGFFLRFVDEPEPVLDYAFRWELRRLTEIEPSHLGWNLVPYYVSAGVAGRRGFELGWDFTLRYWRDAPSSQSVAAGLGVFHRPPPNLEWFAFQVTVQYPQRLSSGSNRSARALSTELAWSPPGMSKLKQAYRTNGTISIGLADLPGILYWGWRFF